MIMQKKNGSPSLALDTRPKESENLSEDKSKGVVCVCIL